MSAPRIPANRNKRPRGTRKNTPVTLGEKSFFPIEALSSDNGKSVPDYPLERRAWATDSEPARRASPLIARLGSTSGAVLGPSGLGLRLSACALGRAVSDRTTAKSEYFRIVFNLCSPEKEYRLLDNYAHSYPFSKVTALNSLVPLTYFPPT